MPDTLLEVNNLVKIYKKPGFLSSFKSNGTYPSIDEISLSLYEGESLGLIGESGSGKTTLGKCILKLETINSGSIKMFNQDVTQFSERKFRSFRKNIQMIFQDLDAALNPNMTIRKTLANVVVRYQKLKKIDLDKRLHELMHDVNLNSRLLHRYPSELSGGQKRRIAIAAVLAISPKIIIADEPTTGLDNYTQSLVMQLITDIQKRNGLSILFISHDLQLLKQHCQRLAVLYLGNIIEIGDTEQIKNQAAHPYTHLLLNSHLAQHTAPHKSSKIAHDIRSGLHDYPRTHTGCQFAPRCQRYNEMGKPEICSKKPKLVRIQEGHQVACHFQLLANDNVRIPEIANIN